MDPVLWNGRVRMKNPVKGRRNPGSGDSPEFGSVVGMTQKPEDPTFNKE